MTPFMRKIFRRLVKRKPNLNLITHVLSQEIDSENQHIVQNANTIDKLLENELSATETYQKVLVELKFPDGKFLFISIIPMLKEYESAVLVLQEQIVKLGGMPHQNSDAWGVWPKLVLENAKLVGKRSVIEVLLKGEKTAEMDYITALQDSAFPTEIRRLIKTNLLPNRQLHVQCLDRVLKLVSD